MFRNSGKSLSSAFFDGVLTFDSRRPLDQRAARESEEGPVAIQESAQREHPGILIKPVPPSFCREQFQTRRLSVYEFRDSISFACVRARDFWSIPKFTRATRRVARYSSPR